MIETLRCRRVSYGLGQLGTQQHSVCALVCVVGSFGCGPHAYRFVLAGRHIITTEKNANLACKCSMFVLPF